MSPRVSDEHKAARRRQILDAAGRCFARGGYDRTGMDDILKESGLSAGAVYAYFPGKLDIFLALAERDLERDLARYAAAASASEPAPARLERLVSLLMASFASPQEQEFHRLYLLQLLPAAPDNPALRDRLRQRNGRIHELLVAVITEGVERGEFRPVNAAAVAALIVAAGDGLRLHALTIDTLAPPDEMFHAFLANLRQALQP